MTTPTPEHIRQIRVFLAQRETTLLTMRSGPSRDRVEGQADALRILMDDYARLSALLTGPMPESLHRDVQEIIRRKACTAVDVHHVYQEAAGRPLGSGPGGPDEPVPVSTAPKEEA